MKRRQFSAFASASTSQPSSQSGFTLIEIIIVMVIIGILVALAGGSFITSQIKGRDARRKADLKQMATALELYANDHPYGTNFRYPSHNGSYQIVGCGTVLAPTACSWGTAFQQRGTGASADTVYMPQLPADPKNPNMTYHYEAHANGQWFILFARLENTEDAAVPKSGSDPMVYDGVDCGGSECNYAVSSSNIVPSDIKTLVTE